MVRCLLLSVRVFDISVIASCPLNCLRQDSSSVWWCDEVINSCLQSLFSSRPPLNFQKNHFLFFKCHGQWTLPRFIIKWVNIYCDNLKDFANVFHIYDRLGLHGSLSCFLSLRFVMLIIFMRTSQFVSATTTAFTALVSAGEERASDEMSTPFLLLQQAAPCQYFNSGFDINTSRQFFCFAKPAIFTYCQESST